MKEEEIQSKIIHDLSILYELSLSSANSSSVIGNCSSFLKVLISRKNLSFAGYWLLNEKKQQLDSFFSFPAIEKKEEASLKMDFFELVNHEGRLINSEHEEHEMLCNACNLKSGSFLLFQIGKESLIILNRNDKELNNKDRLQLNTVINKFGLFIEGLISQGKLTEEIQIRRAAEEELKTKTKELNLK